MQPLKLASLLCSLVLSAGCASKVVPIADSRPFCGAVKHVCIDRDDVLTEMTATQIEANNLGRAPICGKPKPCKDLRQAQINKANTAKLPALKLIAKR
jgi:hypothetical protein